MNSVNISQDEYTRLKLLADEVYKILGSETIIPVTVDRYLALLEAEEDLNALHGAGVDNWEGYYIAMDMRAGKAW